MINILKKLSIIFPLYLAYLVFIALMITKGQNQEDFTTSWFVDFMLLQSVFFVSVLFSIKSALWYYKFKPGEFYLRIKEEWE
jgi:hypothetical protein